MENDKRRKNIRLNGFDYSNSGAYFITVCTYNRKNIFGYVTDKSEKEIEKEYPSDYIVGADSISARMVTRIYYELIEKYEGYKSLGFVVMPDHVHMIIGIYRADMESAPTKISDFIRDFKRYSTIEYIKKVKNGIVPPFEKHIWQRTYYDHIIRNQNDLDNIRQYMKNNPKAYIYVKTT